MKFKMSARIAVLMFAIFSSTHAFAVSGTVGGGGGNTVGDDLFDDYENKGTEKIPLAELTALAMPVLKDLDLRVPALGRRLRQGLSGIDWYTEPKPLNQSGVCRNGSETGLTPAIGQVVRACQNQFDVRIEKAWYDDKKQNAPQLLTNLVVHELLVYLRIRHPKISEEGLFRVSRDIRAPGTSDFDLQKDLELVGFGHYQIGVQPLQAGDFVFAADDDEHFGTIYTSADFMDVKSDMTVAGVKGDKTVVRIKADYQQVSFKTFLTRRVYLKEGCSAGFCVGDVVEFSAAYQNAFFQGQAAEMRKLFGKLSKQWLDKEIQKLLSLKPDRSTYKIRGVNNLGRFLVFSTEMNTMTEAPLSALVLHGN